MWRWCSSWTTLPSAIAFRCHRLDLLVGAHIEVGADKLASCLGGDDLRPRGSELLASIHQNGNSSSSSFKMSATPLPMDAWRSASGTTWISKFL